MAPATLPDQAFILAAGLGTRLRPYTNDIPKPMVAVHGKPMIDHALDALEGIGVTSCVINTHYKAEVLEHHLAKRTRPHITISREEELLDTGGGLVKMISHFKRPFFVLAGDSVWEDRGASALETLTKAWDQERMDILILLQPVDTMKLTHGVGDYMLDANGRAKRSRDKSGEYMFTSIRINAPHIFDGYGVKPFSYLELLDKAEQQGRLYGLVHEGMWHHISTPEDLEKVNAADV